jgi:hypothetical protein
MAKQKSPLERFWKSSFPPAAVVGAFVSFITAAFRPRHESRADYPKKNPLIQISFSDKPKATATASVALKMQYTEVFVLGGPASPYQFRNPLLGVAVGSADRIFVLGDDTVQIFDSGGNLIRKTKAPDGAVCFAVGPDERIYFGLPGRVEICDGSGIPRGGFPAGEGGRYANLTSIKLAGQEILVADAAARCIRRYSREGKQLGIIGVHGKNRGFMLPNRSLDIGTDAGGTIWATDSGRHRVSSWRIDGTPVGYFGKFGLADPGDFVGCCNPVNLSIAPDGKIVTGEKVIARVKVYDPKGVLLGLVGPEHFDQNSTHLFLAIDSKGRIMVADPVGLNVKVFSAVSRPGDSINV